jgi:hypothetical protein
LNPLLKAYISGQARRAAVVEGESLVCLEAGGGQTVLRNLFEFEYLFADVGDLRALQCKDWIEVSQKLETASRQDDALALFLILLDGGADSEARRGAVPLVEVALRDPGVGEFLLKRFSCSPLPSNADLDGSIALTVLMDVAAMAGILRRIGDLQKAVKGVCSAWESLPDELFVSLPDKTTLHRFLRDLGVFYCLSTNDQNGALAVIKTVPADQEQRLATLIRTWYSKVSECLPVAQETAAITTADMFVEAYDKLRLLAERIIASQPDGTMAAEDLVTVAFLKLHQRDYEWKDRSQFFAVVASAMRFIIIDLSRKRRSNRRREQQEPSAVENADEMLTLDQALAQLSKIDDHGQGY